MKAATALVILASAIPYASAHYTFPALIQDGSVTPEWKYVRQWTGYYTNCPVTDIDSVDFRCGKDGTNGSSTETLSVPAGSTFGFTVGGSIYHPGPAQLYMAKVPEGETASSWDGSGEVWFKVYGEEPKIDADGLKWPSDGVTTVTTDIPDSLPEGGYLIRVEHIALHGASSPGGAQFYISCGQLTVTGGGNGSPSPLVAFPGAYAPKDPSIMINLYYPIPTEYTPPGPPVWTG